MAGLGLPEHAAGSVEFTLVVIFEVVALVPERDGGVCRYGTFGEEEDGDAPSAAIAALAAGGDHH